MTHAIAELQARLETLKTNEPINRAEGNIAQADLERDAIADILEAISILTAASKPTTFLDRLLVEKRDLAAKIEKLAAFVETPRFHSLSPGERERLSLQLGVMRQYDTILGDRITALGVDGGRLPAGHPLGCAADPDSHA